MYGIDSLSSTTCSDTDLSNGIVLDTGYNNEVLIELNRFYNITRYKVETLIKNKSLNCLITKYDLIDPNGLKDILALHKLDIHQEKVLKIALILSRAINNRTIHNDTNDNEENVEDRHSDNHTEIHYNPPEVHLSPPTEIQSNSLHPAVSSSNYLSLKSKTTPRDRGGDEVSDGSSIMGMMEDGAKIVLDVTSSGIPGIKVYATSSSKPTRKNIKILPGRTSEFYPEEQTYNINHNIQLPIDNHSIPIPSEVTPDVTTLCSTRSGGSPLEVQSNSRCPADSSPPLEVQSTSVPLAESSSNYLPVNGNATPGDRGELSETIYGSRGEVNKKATTASGMKSSTGPQVEPVADLWEFEGYINREGHHGEWNTSSGGAVCKTKRARRNSSGVEGSYGMKCSTGPQVEPVADLREAEGEVNRRGHHGEWKSSGGGCLQDEDRCNIECKSSLDLTDVDDDISLEYINMIINDEAIFDGIDMIIMKLLFNICIWLVETGYNLNILNLSYELMIKLLYCMDRLNEEIELYLRYIINDIDDNNNEYIYWRLRLIQIGIYKLKLCNKDINNITIYINNIINNDKLNIYIYDELICITCQIWLITNKLINIPYKYKLIVIIKLLNINEYNILNNININELIYKLLYSNIEIRKLLLKIIELSIYKLNYKFIYKFINRIINRKNFYKFIDLNILKYDILSTIIILHLYNNTFDIISFYIFLFLSILSININHYINYYINFINLNNDNIINNIIKLWIIINTIKYPCIYFDRFIKILIKFTINIIYYLIYQHDYNNIIIILKSILHTIQITNASNHYSFIPYAIDLITNISTHYNLLVCNTIQKYINKIIKKILVNNVQYLIHCGTPPEVTNSSSTRRGASPPEVTTTVGLADSSSNYLSLKSKATPRDRGEVSDGSSIMGMMEDGAKVEIRIGPQVEPVADLREAKGEGRDGSSIMGMMEDGAKDVLDVTTSGSGKPGADLREAEGEVNRGGHHGEWKDKAVVEGGGEDSRKDWTSGRIISGGMCILSNVMRYRMRGMRELILNDFTPYITLSLTRCFCEMSKHVSIGGYMLELFLLLFNDVSSTNYIITGLYYNILFNFGFNLCRVLTRFFLYIQSQNWDSNTFTNIRRVMRLFLFKKNKINTKLTKKRNTNGFVLSKLHMPYTRINKGKVYISNKNMTSCSFNDYLQHLLDKEFVHIKGNSDIPILGKDYSLNKEAKKLKHHDCPGE